VSGYFADMAKLPKRPRDSAQLAKFIVDVASGQLPNEKPIVDSTAERGHARARSLTPKRRKAIAKKAAAARWGKRK
jgi:hypothetical protein